MAKQYRKFFGKQIMDNANQTMANATHSRCNAISVMCLLGVLTVGCAELVVMASMFAKAEDKSASWSTPSALRAARDLECCGRAA